MFYFLFKKQILILHQVVFPSTVVKADAVHFFCEPTCPVGRFTARLFLIFYITNVGVVLHQGSEAVRVIDFVRSLVLVLLAVRRAHRPSVKFRGWAHPEGVVFFTQFHCCFALLNNFSVYKSPFLYKSNFL